MYESMEVDGQFIQISPPSGKELEELLAYADENATDVDADNAIDRGPGGTCYYDDVVDEEVVSWCFAYARKHPEDEYIQNRVLNFHLRYQELLKEGKSLPGYDETYFAEQSAE